MSEPEEEKVPSPAELEQDFKAFLAKKYSDRFVLAFFTQPSELMQTPSIGELAGALAKAQGEIQQAHKDKDNPFFKSKYADLASNWDACRKPLADNGLSLTQTIELDFANERPPYKKTIKKYKQGTKTIEAETVIETVLHGHLLVTVLRHSSGEWIKGVYRFYAPIDDHQAFGSAYTYGRRYTLAGMVGVAPADDDGETAMNRTQGTSPTSTKSASKNNEAKTQLDSMKKEFTSLFAKLKKLPSGEYDEKWVAGFLQKEFGVDSIWKCKAGQLEKMKSVYQQLQKTLNNRPENVEKEFSEATDLHKKIRDYAARVKQLNPMFGDSWFATQCGRFGGVEVEEITDMKSLEELLRVIEAKGKELKAAQ